MPKKDFRPEVFSDSNIWGRDYLFLITCFCLLSNSFPLLVILSNNHRALNVCIINYIVNACVCAWSIESWNSLKVLRCRLTPGTSVDEIKFCKVSNSTIKTSGLSFISNIWLQCYNPGNILLVPHTTAPSPLQCWLSLRSAFSLATFDFNSTIQAISCWSPAPLPSCPFNVGSHCGLRCHQHWAGGSGERMFIVILRKGGASILAGIVAFFVPSAHNN